MVHDSGKRLFERLPKSVIPVNYSLQLTPDLSALTFDGEMSVKVKVNEPTDTVILNSSDIVVGSASVNDLKANIEHNEPDEKLVLKLGKSLPVGDGLVKMKFKGNLNDQMKGFYRSKYKSLDGEERFCAVTQFEPTDARRAFPCWDEPAVKATFDISLVVPKDRVALSNMPVKSDTVLADNPERRLVTFDRTPIMSTYLIAFIVGEYDHIEARDSNGILHRVYTPLGKKEHGRFALEVSVKTVPYYTNYFSIPYPLPKIDLIALADFAADSRECLKGIVPILPNHKFSGTSAMENWGLVTYRETALLVDPETSSAAQRERVAVVVGHELAHQWFGNLVTMEWWTHLWLNEGFASFIEYLCVDHCFPDYNIWQTFVNMDFTRGLESDALHNSHPIEVPVGHPAEIDEIFDAISYSKGSSVIRMLHQYIGDDAFRKGLHNYLTQHSYKNTVTEDLWDALGKASGLPVAAVMSTWTLQMGYPLISIKSKKEGNKRTITLSQEKFCADGKVPADSPTWMVPIDIVSSSNPKKPIKSLVLEAKSTTVTLDNVPPSDWIKINPGSVGFYRTHYSSEMMSDILPSVSDRSLPVLDRLLLLNDSYALARAGLAPTSDVLKLMVALKNETDYSVWNNLASNHSTIGVIMQCAGAQDQWANFTKELFRTIFKSVGWAPKENEGHQAAMLRELVLTKMGAAGEQAVIDEARKRFAKHYDGTELIRADLRRPVYLSVLRHGGEAELDKAIDLANKAETTVERVRLQRVLGAVKDTGLIKKVLAYGLSDKVRSQDFVFVLAGCTHSVEGREVVWEFVRSNWQELYRRYQGLFLLAHLVGISCDNFATEEKAQEVKAFFEAHPVPAAERTVRQAIENIHLNMNWLQRDGEAIRHFISA